MQGAKGFGLSGREPQLPGEGSGMRERGNPGQPQFYFHLGSQSFLPSSSNQLSLQSLGMRKDSRLSAPGGHFTGVFPMDVSRVRHPLPWPFPWMSPGSDIPFPSLSHGCLQRQTCLSLAFLCSRQGLYALGSVQRPLHPALLSTSCGFCRCCVYC